LILVVTFCNIDPQVEVFRVEKRKFDLEVSKWDDTGNDIIVLAKHMCMIMMEMTDFTRGAISFYD
jgi:catenin alpha